jgi:hypothetical protein
VHTPSKSEFLGAFILLNDALRVERVAVQDPETNLAISYRTILSDPLTFRFTLMESKTAGDVAVTAVLAVRRGGTSSEEELNTIRRTMSSTRMLKPGDEVLKMRVQRCIEVYEYLTAQGQASLQMAAFTGAVGDVYNTYDVKKVETIIQKEEKKHRLEAEIAFLEKTNLQLEKRGGTKKNTVNWKSINDNKEKIKKYQTELAEVYEGIRKDNAKLMEVENTTLKVPPEELPWTKKKQDDGIDESL